jgi:hypothetical protein
LSDDNISAGHILLTDDKYYRQPAFHVMRITLNNLPNMILIVPEINSACIRSRPYDSVSKNNFRLQSHETRL